MILTFNTVIPFSKDTPAYDAVLSNQVWLQTDQHFRRYSRNSLIFGYISPRCDVDNEDIETIFLQDTLAHDAVQTYQVR